MKFDNIVIVLGKRLIDNNLTPEGTSRVQALADALDWLPIESTILVFCGGVTQGQTIAEADAMYRHFQTLSAMRQTPFPSQFLPNSQVLIENRSQNTMQNMQYAAEILCRSKRFEPDSDNDDPINVILLSNDYHLERVIQIQSLMDEQGLLRVLKSHCASMGLKLSIPLDIKQHISVPYPHKGALAEAFLLLDELTTYRVYLEGVKAEAFARSLSEVRAQPLANARKAIQGLQALALDVDVQEQIEEMKKAIEMTAFDESMGTATRALQIFHPLLTDLNRRLDPESSLE